MKILKYLISIVLILALIFLAIGIIVPSTTYDSQITVNKSFNEAWAVMSDESKLPLWLNGYMKSELVSGTANTVGAVSNIHFNQDGQEMIIQETITKIVPNELIAMRFNADDFMLMDYAMHFTESDGKTTIKSQTTTTGQGMMAKSMVALMKNTMITQEETNMASLKKIIEENTTNYFPLLEEIEQDSIR